MASGFHTKHLQKIHRAYEYLAGYHSKRPDVGIVLGTGLGGLLADVEAEAAVNYQDIPHFPISTVDSHFGKLIFGKIGGKSVVIMKGRFHYYEGYSMKKVTFPIRVMKLLGIKHLIISNAAGGLSPEFSVGDCMVIEDHIDLFPENPLRGRNLDTLGPRFPDMSESYDKTLIGKAFAIAKEKGLHLHQGIYAGLPGPNLETRSEYKYLRTIGADAVGMSTVPEVIVARHMDIPVFALSAITDLCTPGNVQKISIEDVIAAAAVAEPKMTTIIQALIEQL